MPDPAPNPSAQEALVASLVSAALQPVLARVAELEAATASHIAQTVAGGATGGHWATWFEKFKHLVGVANAVVAVAQPVATAVESPKT